MTVFAILLTSDWIEIRGQAVSGRLFDMKPISVTDPYGVFTLK